VRIDGVVRQGWPGDDGARRFVNPGIIPARMWKHLYIQGKTPQKLLIWRQCPPITSGRLLIGCGK
jgi:hypothetical protein